MEEFKSRMIILVLGILLVVFVAFWLLGSIWTSNISTNNIDNNDKEDEISAQNISQNVLGNIYAVTGGRDKMLKEYFDNIFKVFASGDENEIYSITSKYYLDKYNLNSSGLYKKLYNKGLIGKAFQCTKYAVAENQRFGRIYSLEITSADNKVIDKIIILEESPRNYKISFDSYIGKRAQDVDITKDGLKMQIISVEEYKDVVYFRVSLENTSEDVMILNKLRNASEAIYVNLSGNVKIFNTKDFFTGKSITLNPGEKITTDLEFFISDLQSYKIKEICVVDVYNETSQVTETYEYSIYDN